MDIVSFKTFKTTEEFEKWQIEDKPKIISVSPILQEMGIDIDVRVTNAGTEFGAFVQYWKNIDK